MGTRAGGLFGHAGLGQALEKHVAMGKMGEVPAQHAEADRRPEFVAGGDVFLRFLD
jgi:hypothetical protein